VKFRALAIVASAAFALVASGCAGSTTNDALRDSSTALATPAPEPAPPTTTVAPATCENREASLLPDATIAPDSWMEEIRKRDRLVVGVDQNTALFGFRDPRSRAISGLDVDLLRAVARAIFDEPKGASIDHKIDFRAVTTSQRLPAVQNGDVDIVASLITATCERQEQAGLSTVYFRAAQEILVRDQSIRSIDDLAGRRVCATAGSTSFTQFKTAQPEAVMVEVPVRTDCLVALQDARVDAITADSTILEGFRSQDPTTKLLDRQLSEEPYVIAVSNSHLEFVRFVNAVLQRMREDGELAELYTKWLGNHAPPVPTPAYRS
jgi:polar amino acid transport system substrate-binding protein